MARYKCPGCGRPYNGKRCRECYYETFTEEIAHGNHVHEGEPLVLSKTPPRQRPRPTISKKPDCAPYTGRKKKDSPLKWLVAALVVLVSLFAEFADTVQVGDVVEVIPDFNETYSVPTNREPEAPAALEDGLVLYDEKDVRIVAEWEDGQEYREDIPIYISNQTDRELSVSSYGVYVNGFFMEGAVIYCDILPGETVREYLWLDEYELEACGIETVAEIMLCLDIYDEESYEPYARSEWVTLYCGVPGDFVQPVERGGQVLCEQDGVKVAYHGCEGMDCEDAWLVFLVENESDKTLELYPGEVYVNGSETDLFLWCDLLPGTRAVLRMPLYSLPEMGVDTVDEIQSLELSFGWVFNEDWDNWTQTEMLTVDVDN